MPGRKGFYDDSYLTPRKLLRTVTAADANVGAVPSSTYINTLTDKEGNYNRIGYKNRIYLEVYGASLVSAVVELWIDITNGSGAPKWCKVQGFSVNGQEVLMADFLVPGIYAVFVKALTATGDVEINEMHTE